MILYILGYESARTAIADYVSTPSSTVTAKVGLVPFELEILPCMQKAK